MKQLSKIVYPFVSHSTSSIQDIPDDVWFCSRWTLKSTALKISLQLPIYCFNVDLLRRWELDPQKLPCRNWWQAKKFKSCPKAHISTTIYMESLLWMTTLSYDQLNPSLSTSTIMHITDERQWMFPWYCATCTATLRGIHHTSSDVAHFSSCSYCVRVLRSCFFSWYAK